LTVAVSSTDVRPSRFKRWIVQPVVNQLKQGTTPEKLSWSISLGATLGIFPIMGSTSVVCLVIGHIFKLNQAVIHLFKTLTYPIHLPMILVFIHLGEKLNGVPPTSFSITQLVIQFKENPAQFASDFGMAALYGIEAWAISAVFLIPLLRYASLPLLRKLVQKKEATS
jgi:uncharacterized protein (DUF2062 family)|tara:strand:+ start:13721 stop:14224 length:504 start_codon:yes stop_codon:yes gene_type:complete